MSTGLFQNIGVVKADQLIDGPNTPGQNRKKALEAGPLWVGQCHVTALNAPSQWHHHEEFDSVMYMLSGRIRVDYGEGGSKSFEIGKGDYAYFPRWAIHRCQIIEGGDDVHYVFVRLGEGETVVNVDGPGFTPAQRSLMSDGDGGRTSQATGFYGPQYSRTDSALATEIRKEVFGDDIGQESWRSTAEQVEIGDFLLLTPESRLLDVACGAGGPSLALVERFGCRLVGLDLEPQGVVHGNALAARRGLSDRATFSACDCGAKLPIEDSAFDAILCIDAVCHLPDRFAASSDWARLLRNGGRLVFTDPFVVTGALSKGEIDGRSALGANLFFVPPGLNEQAIREAGLKLLHRYDRADAVAAIASRWHDARLRRSDILRCEEGEEWFERRQLMLATSAKLAEDRRLSRFLYVAEKPS